MINATGNRMTMEIRRQSNLAQNISDTQISISTGRRIQHASEDPVASARIANIRQAQADSNAWGNNLALGSSLAAQADGVLKNISDRMLRAQELIVAGANGNLGVEDRKTIALELRGISSEIASYADTRSSLGQPLFANGNALAIRFGESDIFAPVPSRAEIFSISGVSLDQIIGDAADAIENGNSVQIGTSLTAIAGAVDHVADAAADIGVRASRLDRLQESLITRGIEFSAERSTLEDTDLSEAIAKLNGQTITLEAAQAAFARINRRTLFDILG